MVKSTSASCSMHGLVRKPPIDMQQVSIRDRCACGVWVRARVGVRVWVRARVGVRVWAFARVRLL